MPETLEQVLADERVGYVYYLADRRTPRWPRYVGSTADPLTRLATHRKPSGSRNGALTSWKAAVVADGSAVIMRIIREYADIAEAREAEWRLIHRWRRRGLCDLNTDREGQHAAFVAMCTHRRRRGWWRGNVSA